MARSVGGPLTHTHQMEGASFAFGRGLPVRALGRLGEVDLLGPNVDQNVLALVAPLEVSPVLFVYLPTGAGYITEIEAHRGSPYHLERFAGRRLDDIASGDSN